MTWRYLPILALAASCLAFPQQSGSLDDLISNVFNNNHQGANQQQPPNQGVTQPSNAGGQGGDLDSLINSVFRPNSKEGDGTTSGTILGTNNRATPPPGDCECVPYYQCREGKILENGVGIIDIRSGFGMIDVHGALGPCDNYLDVCCKPPDLTKPGEKITPTSPTRTGCGQRNKEGVGFRITGQRDNEAQFGEFPWMVAILKEESIGNDGQKLNVYQCGGALIHSRAVLTAAHCVNGKQPSELRVRAGEWDTQTKNEVFSHQDRNVETVVVHEKFHSGALSNDYAILILSQPVEIAENVDLVCLPDDSTAFNSTDCFASGWGKDMFGKEGHYQVILKRVGLPIVPHDTCQESLRTTRLGKYFSLHDTFICAGGQPGKDTCKGDGGSPLVCSLSSNPSKYVQVGIVAWGIGCGENNTPGVYANIMKARPWIDEQMAYYNLDTTVYQFEQ